MLYSLIIGSKGDIQTTVIKASGRNLAIYKYFRRNPAPVGSIFKIKLIDENDKSYYYIAEMVDSPSGKVLDIRRVQRGSA